MLLESIEDTQAVHNLLFDPIIGGYKFGHQRQDVVKKSIWDNDDSFNRITKDDVTLDQNISVCHVVDINIAKMQTNLLTGETVTPPIDIGTFRAPGLVSAPAPTVEEARAQTSKQSKNLS